MGKIYHNITTKHNKVWTIYIILGMYSIEGKISTPDICLISNGLLVFKEL